MVSILSTIAPYLSESHFSYAKPKGGQRICAAGRPMLGVETPRGTNGLEAANRLRRPEWNNLCEAIVYRGRAASLNFAAPEAV